MKLWKRGIAALLLLSVLLAQTFVSAKSISDESLNNLDKLMAFGIVSGNPDPEDTPVTRGQMADLVCRAANIAVDSFVPRGDIYADVPKDCAYVNAIEVANGMGIVSDAEMFYPDRQITFNEAVVMVLNAMGYQRAAAYMGGYPEGYNSLASKQSITKGVPAGKITWDSAIRLISNMLDSDVIDFTPSGANISYTIDNERTFLEKAFDVVKYKATIDEINTGDEKITFTVKDKVQGNVQYTYPYSETAGVEKAGGDVVIYLDSETETVIFIETKYGSAVFNDFIYEINKNENTQAVNKASLKYVEFKNMGKRYKVSDELHLTYNDDVITTESYDYVNCFAKVVVQNGEVIRMDIYKLSEGGLIYFADDNELGYTRGEDYENYYKGFRNAKDLQIFIDGKFTNKMTDLRTDMVYDFWYNGKDKYILVASSRSKTGVVEGFPKGKIKIDGEVYDISEQYGWYNFEALYNTYRPGDFSQIMGEPVTVFFDDNKEVRYARKDIAKSEKNTFPAFVIRAYTDELEDKEMVKLYRADTEEIVTYPLRDRLKNNSITYDYLTNVQADINALGFLEFTVTGMGEISNISHVEYFGASDTDTAFSEFVEVGDNRHWYPGDATMFIIGMVRGEFTVKKITYADIKYCTTRAAGNTKINVYSDQDLRNNPVPKYIILGGANIADLKYDGTDFDVIESLDWKQDNEWTLKFTNGDVYTVSEDLVNTHGLQADMMVKYYSHWIMGDEPIYITEVQDLSGLSDRWTNTDVYRRGATQGFYKASSILFRNDNVIQFIASGVETDVYWFFDDSVGGQYKMKVYERVGRKLRKVTTQEYVGNKVDSYVRPVMKSPIMNINKGDDVWFHLDTQQGRVAIDYIIYESNANLFE